MTKPQYLEMALKVAMGFGSFSLGINSWLVQDKISEVTESIKELNNRMAEVQVQTAETRRDVMSHDKILNEQGGRLQGVEAVVNRLTGYLERKH